MKKTAKTVTFFPNCKKCKTPTGAATTDEPITLNLRFNRPQNPSEVHFVLTKDGEDAVRYAMNRRACISIISRLATRSRFTA